MHKGAANLVRAAAVSAALTLTACQGEQRAADNRTADADPALTSALQDQILVDPALTQQSNKNAVRPPEMPTQAQYPASEERTAAPAASADCASAIVHNSAWSQRLPAAFAPFPGARVTEAAGSDRPGCRVRIVTFAAPAAPERLIEHYRGRAAGAGYSAERKMRQGDLVLAGSNGSGGTYYLILTPRPNGSSDAAIIVNEG
jgi:hypothetical protein